MERSKSKRISLLRKLVPHKTLSEETEHHSSLPHRSSPAGSTRSSTPLPPSRFPSASGIEEPLSSADILTHLSDLHSAITTHVRKFYSVEDAAEKRVSQAVIEHASTGINLPWPQILGLLGNRDTRLAMLALCIAWTVLSRTLLLKLGTSNSPGSTFLPPEIVECFQSFSLGKGAVTLGKDDTSPVDFSMLSRWKQLTAALSHSTYVDNAFSLFDARTVNIERALKDLDPLLATYAISGDAERANNTRLDDLRLVLRQGARLAFLLFSQPSFWKFDWRSDRAAEHGKAETEADPERTSSIESIGMASTTSVRLTNAEIVVWPALVRVMDGEGVKLNCLNEGILIGEKKYLSEFDNV